MAVMVYSKIPKSPVSKPHNQMQFNVIPGQPILKMCYSSARDSVRLFYAEATW